VNKKERDMTMKQKQYLIEKIVRSAKIENMSIFIEFAELDPADLEFINEKVKPLGYAVNIEEVIQMQIQRQAKKITNCKDKCGSDYWPVTTPSRRESTPSPNEQPQPKEQVKYFVPIENGLAIGA
jgi:hypothetical protein